MRLCLILLVGCVPHAVQVQEVPPDDGPPACRLHERRLSSEGRAGTRPEVPWNRGVFAAVWEDSDDQHSGVRFQPLDAQAASKRVHGTPVIPIAPAM